MLNKRYEDFVKYINSESITVGELLKVLHDNHIPEDCALQSDSGWECSETPMEKIYYNAFENRIIFTQADGDGRDYPSDKWWKLLFDKEEASKEAAKNKIEF